MILPFLYSMCMRAMRKNGSVKKTIYVECDTMMTIMMMSFIFWLFEANQIEEEKKHPNLVDGM